MRGKGERRLGYESNASPNTPQPTTTNPLISKAINAKGAGWYWDRLGITPPQNRHRISLEERRARPRIR
jgi:hypothetical protein